MAEQVAQLLDEKSKDLETLSKCQQEVGTGVETGTHKVFKLTASVR